MSLEYVGFKVDEYNDSLLALSSFKAVLRFVNT